MEEVIENFTASSGKKGTVTSKCLKKINVDCKLQSVTGLDINSLDISMSGYMAKLKVKGGLSTKQFCEFLQTQIAEECAKKKKISKEDAVQKIKDKICGGSAQGHGTTGTSKTGGVEKMTDSSQYTGASKSRFDEGGKGKGIAGREDMVDNTGYVGDYKGKDTFDKKK